MIRKADTGLKRARKALDERHYRDAHAVCIEILKRTPDNSTAITLLAEIAWKTQSHKDAFELFRRAHLIDPDHPAPLIGLAKCFALINNFGNAREAAERAISLQPSDAENLYDLGLVFRFLTDEVQALALFERAVAASPINKQYIFDLGVSRQRHGDVEGAERALLRCLELDGSFSPAYLMLVELRRQTKETNFIPILEKLFAHNGDHLVRHSATGHALAKSYEDIGDLAASISILDSAKSKKREREAYDFARTQAMFEQARRTYPSSTSVGAPNSSDAPIFVFGMPRSGTTLTDRILSSHPLVASFGEIPSFAVATRELSNIANANLDDPKVFQRGTAIDVGRLADAYLSQTPMLLAPNQHFVDKFPYNFLFAGLIHRAMPNARLICLRRDPMDVCLRVRLIMFFKLIKGLRAFGS
jgi:tetratricopeptide (TPR) repeat protein